MNLGNWSTHSHVGVTSAQLKNKFLFFIISQGVLDEIRGVDTDFQPLILQ